MNLKWGGEMNSKCIYYVEGPCEQQLISSLKEPPYLIIPGKVKVFNVTQHLIPKSHILSIQAGTTVTLVFDTDVPVTKFLKKNVELLNRYCSKVKIIYLAQVMNLEDELIRCTDVKSAPELTRSNGLKNFKSDFCKMKSTDCRLLLERHQLDLARLWSTEPPQSFTFIERNSSLVKIE
jgi:hypothetical protein